ncbi:MAG: hypothetical protein GY904_05735, partial [Planctomycetaceae bacterium]|nr:hypothetical protein [Planctomycetaceae bacterium]
ASLGSDPSETRARIVETAIHASKALTIDAVGNQLIDAVVFAGSAAVAKSKDKAIAFSAAGVYVENRVQGLIDASIQGDGSNVTRDGITASSIHLFATDTSVINAIAAAASIAASFAPSNTGVAVGVGLSLAFNEVNNAVSAYVVNTDEGLQTLNKGDVSIYASARTADLFSFDLSSDLSTDKLDDAAESTEASLFAQDRKDDYDFLRRLRDEFKTNG